MNENYISKYLIEMNTFVMNEKVSFPVLSSAPYMKGGRMYFQMMESDFIPFEFTGWRDETLSWHYSCSVSAGLNPSPMAIVKGPDAAKFLKNVMVNNIDKFPVGSTKHGLMCMDNGLIASQGVLLHTAEDTYEAHWLSPYLDYMFTKGEYDATFQNVTGNRVIFQTQGPRSLEMMENAACEDLHDIKFCRFRESTIAGKKVRILRFGMYGCLGYEVHCDVKDAHDVYSKIIEAGIPYGVRRLGFHAYMMDHTPGGSQQMTFHFIPAMDSGLAAFMSPKTDQGEDMDETGLSFGFTTAGSLDDVRKCMVNPLELGLGFVVDYSHDFPGRDALMAYKEQPKKRNITTLKWNYEDLGDIYMSQFRDKETYDLMEWPGRPWESAYGGMTAEYDIVLDKNGNEIGYSAGRTTDYYHRAMVSLAVIDESYINLGDEVIVVWGRPGTKQKKVRAEIAPFPFNTHLKNKTFDVETIPHYKP